MEKPRAVGARAIRNIDIAGTCRGLLKSRIYLLGMRIPKPGRQAHQTVGISLGHSSLRLLRAHARLLEFGDDAGSCPR